MDYQDRIEAIKLRAAEVLPLLSEAEITDLHRLVDSAEPQQIEHYARLAELELADGGDGRSFETELGVWVSNLALARKAGA